MTDPGDPIKNLDRQIRAFRWVRMLSEIPDRRAGSGGEAQAAEQVGEWLSELGFDDVRIAPVASKPRLGLVAALHLGVGGLGLVIGGAAGALLTCFGALSYVGHISGRLSLSRLLPAPPSRNVMGRAGALRPRQRVVLSAHIDAPQSGWIFRDVWLRTARHMRPIQSMVLLAASVVAVAVWLGADVALADWVRFGLAALLGIGVGLGLQWGLAAASPGANDNASGVAAMLTCAEQLMAQLPEGVDLWAVGTGAEEVGLCGMRAFCDDPTEPAPAATYFVNFESVGGGTLHYVRSEGTLPQAYPSLLLELARRVASSGLFGPVRLTDLDLRTDGQVPAARGWPALTLIGLVESGLPRGYHSAADVAEAVDLEMLIRAGDFGAAVAYAALRGEAGPIALV
ncbi:MAG: M28 family peptidase [Deltaproteobacteria bacterium]|nr:MAG: M28 family peptidase [Deltaproteobacteria bacterium]